MLEDVGARLAGIARTLDVHLKRKVIVTCAGDHGVCAEGVSLYPSEVTPQMVYNFVHGGASINVLARHAGAVVKVADLGVNWDFEPDLPIFHKKIHKGTDNFAQGPAMTRAAAVQSIEAGLEIVEELLAEGPVDLLGTGDMGIGNTTPSTAIIAAFSGLPVGQLTGRGTGVDDEGLKRKVAVIEKVAEATFHSFDQRSYELASTVSAPEAARDDRARISPLRADRRRRIRGPDGDRVW